MMQVQGLQIKSVGYGSLITWAFINLFSNQASVYWTSIILRHQKKKKGKERKKKKEKPAGTSSNYFLVCLASQHNTQIILRKCLDGYQEYTKKKRKEGFVDNESYRIIKTSSKIKSMLTNVLGTQGHKVNWEVGSPSVTDLQLDFANDSYVCQTAK